MAEEIHGAGGLAETAQVDALEEAAVDEQADVTTTAGVVIATYQPAEPATGKIA